MSTCCGTWGSRRRAAKCTRLILSIFHQQISTLILEVCSSVLAGSWSRYSRPIDWRVCNFWRRTRFFLSRFVSSKVWRFHFFFLLFRVSQVGWCWFPFLRLWFSIRAAYRSTVETLVAAGCSGFSVGSDNSLSYSGLSISLPSGNFLVGGDLLLMQRHMRNQRWTRCSYFSYVCTHHSTRPLYILFEDDWRASTSNLGIHVIMEEFELFWTWQTNSKQ